MPETPTIEAAADALLQVVTRGGPGAGTPPAEPIRATPFVWVDPPAIPPRGSLDLRGLVADPIGTACRAELRRIGLAIHAAGGRDALDDAEAAIADMDLAHSGWRAVILNSAWAGIGGAA